MFSIGVIKAMNAKPDPVARARRFVRENPLTAKEQGVVKLLAAYDKLKAQHNALREAAAKYRGLCK